MKKISLHCICISILLTCSGCVSSSINDSLALIEQENNKANGRVVNNNVLKQIQTLRGFQHKAEHHTFIYELHTKELKDEDKIILSQIIATENKSITINIAPAKGNNTLQQLALSAERAKRLRSYLNHFNKKIVINFSPRLTGDTINLITGV
jgi:hypothetical protein